MCNADLAFLRTSARPHYERGRDPVRIVDLFAGGGGLSFGAAEAARRAHRGAHVVLAVENDTAAADVYARGFPDANLKRSDIVDVFDGTVGANRTKQERALARDVGPVDILVAGPPCQGNSDLNNHTRRSDPRNALYLVAARATEVLLPTFALVENVPSVVHAEGNVVAKAIATLERVGYVVASDVLDLVRFGVPQRRRRHILLAVRGGLLDPADLLAMRSSCEDHASRNVRWAIGDLLEAASSGGPDAPSTPTADNLARMRWLFTNGAYDLPNHLRPVCHRDKHSYNAMYGRLSWDKPAPTITTGFGSMGQGRFVHPEEPRTLTPHEAARLQTLPDFFDLDATKGRGAWASVIGNAVPPLLGVHLIEPLICALPTTRDSRASTPAGEAPSAEKASRVVVSAPSNHVTRSRGAGSERRDSEPALALRTALHAMGLRFSVDKSIDGKRRRTDIVFPTERVAIYVDRCFWHGCPNHGTVPRQNRKWWLDKLEANRREDADTDKALGVAGWSVRRVWEHDDPEAVAVEVADLVGSIRRRDVRASRVARGIGAALVGPVRDARDVRSIDALRASPRSAASS